MRKTCLTHRKAAVWLAAAFGSAVAVLGGCDHGFVPPEKPLTGSIQVTLTYVGAWPDASEVVDLRFVAMRFVPRDTADFLQLNRMAISDRLDYGVESQKVELSGVETGAFPYSGVAQHFSGDLLAWRPIGIYEDDGGLFFVTAGDTTRIDIHVDFADTPPFPPPLPGDQ